MQINDLMERAGIDRESLLALTLALASVAGGLLGAWVGGGAGLILFLIVFAPAVVLALRHASVRSTAATRRRRR